MKTKFILVCRECNITFEKELANHYYKSDSRFKPLCKSCVGKRISRGIKKKIQETKNILPYSLLNKDDRKEILWYEQGKKCYECEYNKYDWKNGPYELHHVDGNINNKQKENEKLLCCNCHYMTENHRFKGRKHNLKTKELLKNRSFSGINIFNKK